MSNIDSSGGVRGRVGRSMDYSQLLTIRKQGILTSAYRGAVEDSKPVVFNRDKKTSGFDNGVVQVYFQKGGVHLIQHFLFAVLYTSVLVILIFTIVSLQMLS